MDNTYFIKQLEEIINEFNGIKSRATHSDLSGNVQIEEITKVMTKSKAAIVRITGVNSEYYKDIEAVLSKNIWTGDKLKNIIGTVQALKNDLENNYLKTLHDLIQSDVFSDYLEMAEYLEQEGYKDPAAVLVGSTLEAHLRDLCKSNLIDTEFINTKGFKTPKKAEILNADLAKALIYSSAYQKQVTAWLGIRNFAAHGRYNDFTKEEVQLMLQGVRQFILFTN